MTKSGTANRVRQLITTRERPSSGRFVPRLYPLVCRRTTARMQTPFKRGSGYTRNFLSSSVSTSPPFILGVSRACRALGAAPSAVMGSRHWQAGLSSPELGGRRHGRRDGRSCAAWQFRRDTGTQWVPTQKGIPPRPGLSPAQTNPASDRPNDCSHCRRPATGATWTLMSGRRASPSFHYFIVRFPGGAGASHCSGCG